LSYKVKNLERIDGDKVKLNLEIANSYLRKSVNKAYKDISNKAKIPGFRKGKIPNQIIDLNFGKKYVLSEAASISISELYPEIIMSEDIKPIDHPKINITQLEEDLPLGFEVVVDVEPQPKLPTYKGIKAAGLSTEVTDEEVEKQVTNIRNKFASLEPVEDDKLAVKGDYVTIDFTGKIDGKEFEGGSAEDYVLEIGSNTLFKEFEDTLVGMKKGDKKSITITLPDNIENRELTGKQADFDIAIKEIKRKVLPEVDEDFLKNMGDYKDIDEFKSYIEGKLSEQKKIARRNRIIEDVFKYLVENTKIDIPPAMIKNRLNIIRDGFEKRLNEQKVSKKNYLKALNITEDKFDEEIKKRAVDEIKEYIIIEALEKAEKNNIEPTEDEIKKEKENILSEYKKEEDKNKIKEFIESEDGKKNLIGSIRRRKIIDFLIKNAKIVEEEKNDTGEDKKKKLLLPGNNKPDVKNSDKKLWTPSKKNKKE